MIKYENDEITGNVEEIFEYYKNDLCDQIKELSLDGECFDIENTQNNVNLILELLNGLHQDLITDYFKRDTKIRVIDDPRGQLYYDEIGDE